MQSKLGEKVRLSQCKEGDLVFFKNKSKVSHVALVVKAYWMERLSMIRRII